MKRGASCRFFCVFLKMPVIRSVRFNFVFLCYGVFFYAVALIRTVSYIFTSVRSAGGTFVDWNKTKQWKAELTRSFTLYFRLDCVWNARNGTTIAVLSSLSKQKYNAKSSCPSDFPSLAKSSLLSTPHLWPKSDLRGKIKISSTDAAKVRQFFAHVSAGENPLEYESFG